MSFIYKVFISSAANERLYNEMQARGLNSVKQAIKALLLEADETAVARALILAQIRERQRER